MTKVLLNEDAVRLWLDLVLVNFCRKVNDILSLLNVVGGSHLDHLDHFFCGVFQP